MPPSSGWRRRGSAVDVVDPSGRTVSSVPGPTREPVSDKPTLEPKAAWNEPPGCIRPRGLAVRRRWTGKTLRTGGRARIVRKEIGVEPLLRNAANRAIRYLEALPERRVSPSPSALEGLGRFSTHLQDAPLAAADVLEELDTLGSPATVASAGGRFFGFVIGGSLPAPLAANILAAAWDQNAGLETSSPVASTLEKVCRTWLVDLFGLPPESEAGFVTSATMANFTGLAPAPHAVLQPHRSDVEARGLFGAPPFTVIVGDEVHVSVLKALSMLGLGRERVVRVPVDGQGRMIPTQIPHIQSPT